MGTKKTDIAESYNSLKDTHLAHYFNRQDVLRHLVQMGLVTREGEIVPESEWRKIYAKQQRHEKEMERENHRRRLMEAEEAAKRRVKQKIRKRDKAQQIQLARQPSASEPDLIHFDIEWTYRPASINTEGGRTSSETQGTSNGTSDSTSGGQNGTFGPSDGGLSCGSNDSKGRFDRDRIRISGLNGSSPETDTRKSNKYPSKPRFIGRRGVVGEPYVASLGPNPSPKYIHILKPTNSCREVWSRLCPPQPICSRPPRAPSPPHLRLVYARGGAPCHTPTDLALEQQPAGAHNVTVFHGTVQEGDEIEFSSLRREDFPFSLTIYEHGVTTGRLSACCEHRYAPGSRLGGPSGHLRVVEIVGGEPCFRCQMRSVEKRQSSLVRGSPLKPRSKGQRGQPCALTEETESENGSPEEDSSHTESTRSSQKDQVTLQSSSQITSDSSSDIDGSSKHYNKPKKSDLKGNCQSSDSCNGPSDLEVAKALGVVLESPQSSKRQKGKRKHSRKQGKSPSRSRASSVDNKDKKLNRARKSVENEQVPSAHNSMIPNNTSGRQKPYITSSSLEGQLDDSIHGRRKYQDGPKIKFSSRHSSATSRRSRGDRSRSRQSNGERFDSQMRVDSFYSQQTFTSSASENQAHSDNATEASYGSSWEEEDEDDNAENESDVREDESVEETEESQSANSKEEYMDTENERTVSSEGANGSDQEDIRESVEDNTLGSEKENTYESDEIDSEVASHHSSADDTVRESDKSVGCSISEDVGDESDIVGLSCSEEDIIEE